jgi:AAHS family 4-hydroxybenzoate transporter-like MFS transporter
MRATLIMYSGVGFTGGARVRGVRCHPPLSRRTVGSQSFYFGGAIPLLIGVVMLVALPESLQFMALRRKNPAKLAHWLNQVNPSVRATPNDEFVARAREQGRRAHRASVPRRARGRDDRLLDRQLHDLLNLLFAGKLATYSGTRRRLLGATAVLVGTVLQVGGTLGTVGLACSSHARDSCGS